MNAEDWTGVAGSFTDDAVRIPPHEEPHRGRAAIEGWLRGIEELVSYELTRDALDGAEGLSVRAAAATRSRCALCGAHRRTISDSGDFLEVWRREPDGAWRVADAIWNTRTPLGV